MEGPAAEEAEARVELLERGEEQVAETRPAVVGSTDETGSEVKDDPVRVEDLTATIYERVGIDPAKEYKTDIGRPVKLSNGGAILTPKLT